jgi:hypothetical protein
MYLGVQRLSLDGISMSSNAPPNPQTEQQIRMGIARDIVLLFNPERYTYMILSGLAALIVLVECSIAIKNHSIQTSTGATLFGSGGLVAFNLGRLLTMFNTVIENVFRASTAGAGTNGS